jgi:hypothetical protein
MSCVVDAQVMVERGEEIAWAADTVDGMFAALIRGADKSARGDAAARPDI